MPIHEKNLIRPENLKTHENLTIFLLCGSDSFDDSPESVEWAGSSPDCVSAPVGCRRSTRASSGTSASF